MDGPLIVVVLIVVVVFDVVAAVGVSLVVILWVVNL